MRLLFGGKEYEFQTEDNNLVESIKKLLPLHLQLSRSADHEYYTSLSQNVSVSEAISTSHVVAGGVYYFKDWNAFSLNFKEMDITPYKVFVIGQVAGSIESALADAGRNIEIEIRD